MGRFEYKQSWLDIVRQQEQALKLPRFTRADAMAVGLEIVRLAEQVYHGSAAVAVLEDGVAVFTFKMEGTDLENEWWMRRKLAASTLCGMSSLRAYLEIEAGLRAPLPNEEAFVACGGCVPVKLDGRERIYILASGLRHFEDHQVIIDALASRFHFKCEVLSAP